jgi:hypothetical protein
MRWPVVLRSYQKADGSWRGSGFRGVIKFMCDSVCTEVLCAGHNLTVSLHKTANPLKWEEHRRHLRFFSSL